MLIAVIIGCTLVMLGTISYLTFLWFGGPMRRSWKSIVLSNWTATSVAICALAIRWMSGFQTILCTSILALMLLRKGVPISRIPRISTIRFSTSGPLDIMLAVPSLWKQSFHLSFVCLLTLIVSLGLQFSSTLLLSDLATAPVETFTDNAAGVGLGQFDGGSLPQYEVGRYFYSDPLLSTTPSYPVFAEYAYPDIYKPYVSPLDTLIDDTEPVIRALFPVATQENRSQLLSFDGNATLYDARWVCMPPHLEDLKLIGNLDGGVLSGSVNFSVRAPELYYRQGYGNSFECLVDYTSLSTTSTSWTLFTCCLTPSEWGSSDQFSLGGIVSALDYKANLSGVYDYSDQNTEDEPQGIGYTWLVINVTDFDPYSGVPGTLTGYNYTFDDPSAWDTSSGDSGPWVRITSSQKHARRVWTTCTSSE